MHPTEVDQGVTLAGRYRVAELLAEAPGDGGVAQTWRAVDEVLSRSVVIHVLAADDPRADGMLEASRNAATVSDVRFLRVLDALREDGIAYVVREWVEGRTLADILSEGPLPPRDAGLVVREVSEALGRAHEQQLYHERLDPDSVVITDSGTVKIVGLATHAALSGGGEPPRSDPARADTVGLGRLLYAALTGKWPTGPRSGLPAGPRAADGTLLSPRQCRAGVPRALDEITERILSDRPRHGTPLSGPRDVVDALTGTVGTTPPEGVLASSRAPVASTAFLAGPPTAGQNSGGPPDADATQVVAHRPGGYGGPGGQGGPGGPPHGPYGRPPAGRGGPGGHGGHGGHGGPGGPPRHDPYARSARPPGGRGGYQRAPQRPKRSRTGIVVVALVFLLGAALFGWVLVSGPFNLPGTGNRPNPDPGKYNIDSSPGSSPSGKTKKPYEITEARAFDPEPAGNNEEHDDEVDQAHDGDTETAWTTREYKGVNLGNQKPGVGIWFDLGQEVDVSRVDLELFGEGETDLEVRVAPEGSTEAPAGLDDWQEGATKTGLGKTEKVQLEQPVKTRYVLVWLTKIPPLADKAGWARGGVSEIAVRP